MKIFIAADMPDPNEESFPEAVIKAVAHFTAQSRGRAFVLFTNAALMRQAAEKLRNHFEENGYLFLVQGEGLPRHAMLEAFRQAGSLPEMQISEPQRSEISKAKKLQLLAAGWSASGGKIKNPKSKIEKAVLFGLESFWMGVDVPGEALSNVIIVRLPFAVPDEPLVKARINLLTNQGKDAFREYSLPQAILKFRQGVGRLIRTATDTGIIVVLDSRIITRWYGKFFLKSIPECPIESVRLKEEVPNHKNLESESFF
jgi:ATP-dependent DNA helicase DinG